MASDHGDGAGGVGSQTPSAYLRSVGIGTGLAASGFVAAQLLGIPLAAVLAVFDIGTLSPIGYSAATAMQGIAFAVVIFGFMMYADRPDLLDVRWPWRSRFGRVLRDAGWVLAGVVALFALSVVVAALLQRFDAGAGTNRVVEIGQENPRLFLYLVVLSFLAVGPGEELLFRGGVQGVLRRTFSPVPAVLIASALFGLAHVPAVIASSGSGGVLGYVVTTFLLGAVLGALYEYTDNLLIPILVHGAYNAIQFAAQYVVETGGASMLL